MLGLSDEWAAYQLDVATLTLGRWVDGKLSERTKDGKPLHKLRDLLSDKPAATQPTQFRSAAGLVSKKMAIPASGVW